MNNNGYSKFVLKKISSLPRVDIDKPKFDQSTYIGRAKHFFLLTNPLNILATGAQLERARGIVENYRAGRDVPEAYTIEDVWKAKYLYDSAFHPETGEKSILIGRMSAQMPMNMIITGCMMTFYKTNTAVVFWQWINQTFNAIVNYTNRSGKSEIKTGKIIKCYCLATGGAVATALSLNRVAAQAHPLIGRIVPLAAVAAANCINVPMMRYEEIRNGIAVMDQKNQQVSVSKRVAVLGIFAVIVSRISMCVPPMTLIPVMVNNMTKENGFLTKYPSLNMPFQVITCGLFLTVTTPLGCALYNQRQTIKVKRLEIEVQEQIYKKDPTIEEVWYNKGL
ncbi:sideroflexin-1-3-like [Teleopsis dalmanni]|uniref:sideroflexin-1-3-like n=1 Tax=Teleopsis dalmanni TaxID=139649 RepID=UPI0018CE7F3A|nr:sideroflexin-1-3-like [Teleopsis dalmanni]